MDKNKQIIAIAEYCGWQQVMELHGYIKGIRPPTRGWITVPDYLNDLNAMHNAEKHLLNREGDDWGIYCDNLMDIIVSAAGYSAADLYCHASAATRAEAFLKTIGKWEE